MLRTEGAGVRELNVMAFESTLRASDAPDMGERSVSDAHACDRVCGVSPRRVRGRSMTSLFADVGGIWIGVIGGG